MPGGRLALSVQAAPHADDTWLPIPMPGEVHRVSLGVGCIPDPFFGHNENHVAWMDSREWW